MSSNVSMLTVAAAAQGDAGLPASHVDSQRGTPDDAPVTPFSSVLQREHDGPATSPAPTQPDAQPDPHGHSHRHAKRTGAAPLAPMAGPVPAPPSAMTAGRRKTDGEHMPRAGVGAAPYVPGIRAGGADGPAGVPGDPPSPGNADPKAIGSAIPNGGPTTRQAAGAAPADRGAAAHGATALRTLRAAVQRHRVADGGVPSNHAMGRVDARASQTLAALPVALPAAIPASGAGATARTGANGSRQRAVRGADDAGTASSAGGRAQGRGSREMPMAAAALAVAVGARPGAGAQGDSTRDPSLPSAAMIGGLSSQPGATTAPAMPVPMASPAGTPQFVQEMAQQLAALAQTGASQMTLQVNPPQLGRIQVVIASQHHAIQVAFVAQTAQAVQALQQGLPQLQSALAQQGLSLGQASVAQQGFQGGQPHSQPQRPPGPVPSVVDRGATGAAGSNRAGTRRRGAPAGRIDAFA